MKGFLVVFDRILYFFEFRLDNLLLPTRPHQTSAIFPLLSLPDQIRDMPLECFELFLASV